MTASRGRRKVTIQQRRGTPAEWAALNPILANAEIGVSGVAGAVDRIKVGDGVTPWNELPYVAAAPGYQDATTVQIADVGGLFDSGSVEGALAEAKTVADAALTPAVADGAYDALGAAAAAQAAAIAASEPAGSTAALAAELPAQYAPLGSTGLVTNTLFALSDSLILGGNLESAGAAGPGENTVVAVDGTPANVNHSRSIVSWAVAYLRHRITWAYQYTRSGERTDQLLASWGTAVTPNSTGWIVIWAGTNDVFQGVSTATITANLTSMLDLAKAEGRRPCLLTLPPNANFTLASQRAGLHEVNEWIRNLPATRPEVVVVDAWAIMSPLTGDAPRTGYAVDGLHPSAIAAERVGKAIADMLDPLVPATPPRIVATTDPLNAFGGVAFASSGSGWSAVDIAAAYPVNDEYGGNMAVLTYTAETNVNAGIQYQENISGGRWAHGDVLRASADIEWDASAMISGRQGWPLLQVGLRNSTAAGSAFVYYVYGMNMPGSELVATTYGAATGRCVVQTPPFTIPASGLDRLYILVGNAGMATGTVTVRNVSVWHAD